MTWKPYQRPGDWQKRRALVLERDEHRCAATLESGQRCGHPATVVDHVVPVSRGGTHDLDNLRAICEWHHRKKTSAEGRAARKPRPRQAREPERHPGIIYDDQAGDGTDEQAR